MVSLSVFRVLSGKEQLLKKNVHELLSETPLQSDLGEFDAEQIKKLTQGKSVLKKKTQPILIPISNNEGLIYEVRQESNTIQEPTLIERC